jgi:hypothetical protein
MGSVTESHPADREDESQVSSELVKVPLGHHYLVLYSDIQKLRKLLSYYVKGQIEYHPNSVIVILPYFDTTEKLREILESQGIDVKENQKSGTLFIVDIETVIRNASLRGSYVEKLREFIKEIESKAEGKTVFVVADMSVFRSLGKARELLDYERQLHKELRVEKWKELCFYNQRDFHTMFTKEESEELLEYHNDRVMRL